ncbi:MAG: cysteine--tRNA ligase [Candidatus Pacebacteria bacterium]|nr:cysteine--tRNA ligase [Candidatus Paceibacterota bacterium]
MLKIHNTLTGTKEEFEPIEQNKVRMFVCGPTVYDYIHVGNARTFVFFDVVGRYLEFKNFGLNFVENITDIDDKIITRAKNEGVKPEDIALKYKTAFIEDMGGLKIASVNNYALASEHIGEIINQVKGLIEKGYAYPAPAIKATGDGAVETSGNQDVYFDLDKYSKDFPNEYGSLSNQNLDELKENTRIEMEANKRSPRDFVLWKAQNYSYEPTNESPWGLGRPGWHIEDTAISEKYLGQQYDIHGGGQDLMFPHHEAEIAQQQALSGKIPFVKYWMHGGFLVTKADKMSKSLGNVTNLRDLLKQHNPETIRLYFLSAHYRSPLSYDDKLLNQASVAINRIADFLARIGNASGEENMELNDLLKVCSEKFSTSMDDDFNAPSAIASVFEFIRKTNPLITTNAMSAFQAETINTFFKSTVDRVLGIIPEPKEQSIPSEILELAEQREQHRLDQDWQKADSARDRIESSGFTISDTPFGPLISAK